MLRLNQSQRTLLAEKLCDAGNVAAGALVFGQFLGGQFSVVLAVGGIMAWASLVGWAVALSRERSE